MALIAVLDSIDSLPEVLKAEYKMNTITGKYHLDVPPQNIQVLNEKGVLVAAQYGVEDVLGLRSALDSERNTNDQNKKSLQDKGDISKTDLAALRVRADSKGDKLSESKIEEAVLSRTKDLESQNQEQLDKLTKSNESLTNQVVGMKGNQTITSEIAKHVMSTEYSGGHLLNALQSHFKVEKDDAGNYQTFIVNPHTGEKRYSPNAQGASVQFMTAEELIVESKDKKEFAMFFKPTGKGSGGGGTPTENGASGDPLSHLQEKKSFDASGNELQGQPISEAHTIANLGNALFPSNGQ